MGDKVMGFFDPLDFEGRGSKRSADAAKDAAKTAAASQQEALDYLKEIEALPQALRQQALTKLGGIYGLTVGGGGGGGGGGGAPVNTQALQEERNQLATQLKGTLSTSRPPSSSPATMTPQQYNEYLADPVLWQGIHGPGGQRDAVTTWTPPANAAELKSRIAEIDTQLATGSSGTAAPAYTELQHAITLKKQDIARAQQGVNFWASVDSGRGGDSTKGTIDQGKVARLQYELSQLEAQVPPPTAQAALTGLQDPTGGGGGGGTFGQQDLINQAMNSPLYGALMGGQELGEEAIMRNAGATGGLRSGNVQGNMYDYVTQLQNKALLSSYNEQLAGLQGLASLPSNSNEIGQYISGIGNTQAQGMTAGAAMQAQGTQNSVNNAMGIAGLGIQAYSSGMFSDRQLKKNIVHIGEVNGHKFYKFDWNKLANRLGLYGSTCGCMADEVYSKVPEAVIIKDNYLFVNYSMIGVL